MLFVQTDNYQQQSLLQESFSREGNLFAVPFRATSQINSIFQQLIYQFFKGNSDKNEYKCLQNQQIPQLVKKIKSFIQNVLKLKFSLADLRQILQLILNLHTKVTFLQQYYCKISSQIENQQVQTHLSYKTPQKLSYYNFKQTESRVKQDLKKSYNYIQDHNFKQVECLSQNSTTSHSHNRAKNIEVDQQNIKQILIHSLKSQFPGSPKFSFNQNLDTLKNLNSQKQLQYQNLVNVENQIQDGNTGIHLERPSWIQKKQYQKKKSDFIDSLSGRVHPLPSFLHDEDCLRQLIVKQKKQDLIKSKIIKEAIKKQQESSQEGDDKLRAYSKSIRDIKLNNKLRKSSRKSITNIKNLIDDCREEKRLPTQSNFKTQTTFKGCKFFKDLKQSIIGGQKLNNKNQQKQKQIKNVKQHKNFPAAQIPKNCNKIEQKTTPKFKFY